MIDVIKFAVALTVAGFAVAVCWAVSSEARTARVIGWIDRLKGRK